MLGHLRKTSRLDVGLGLALGGISYLVWALVAGVSRHLVQEMIQVISLSVPTTPRATLFVKMLFVDGGFAIDLAGLIWLVLTLLLVLLASRQRISISWGWLSAVLQCVLAALGGEWVGWAIVRPYVILASSRPKAAPGVLEQVSMISLPVVLCLALVIWVGFLVFLLVERARFNRRGPSMTDGQRTNVYR